MKGNADDTGSVSPQQNKVLDSQETFWSALYAVARPPVKRWVYNSSVPSWRGQEEDVIDDIVQETMYRLLKRARKADNGDVAPIEIPEYLTIVIAHNCFIDRRRREIRLIRFDAYDSLSIEHVVQLTAINPENDAVDSVYQTWMFVKAAKYVKTNMSGKQRLALLRDLAQRMHFGETPTPLQKAFTDNGMDFRQYAGWKSRDKRERGQHCANLSLALKAMKLLAKEDH